MNERATWMKVTTENYLCIVYLYICVFVYLCNCVLVITKNNKPGNDISKKIATNFLLSSLYCLAVFQNGKYFSPELVSTFPFTKPASVSFELLLCLTSYINLNASQLCQIKT